MIGFVPGRLVLIKRGKHMGKECVVIGKDEKDGRWLVADGDLISVHHPKRKNPRHLYPTDRILEKVAERLLGGKPLDDGWLRAQSASRPVTENVFNEEGKNLYGKR